MTPAQTIESPHFTSHYVAWRQARLDAIRAHYGDAFFEGKTVLELGAGYGDLGGALAALGAHVTCCDARAEHLAVIRTRYPQVATVQADLDREWPFGQFDVILHLGLLYHLEPTHRSLHLSCASCTHLVLETEVCDSPDPDVVVTVPEEGYDQAVSGAGCRPTAARVERILSDEGMLFERHDDPGLNASIHVYDWPDGNSGQFAEGMRRFWFARRGAAIHDLRLDVQAGTAPLVAYRGLWDKFDRPGTPGALLRAYRRGVPSLVRLDAPAADLERVLDGVGDPAVNVRRQPVYLVGDGPPAHERLSSIAATAPGLFAITPGARDGDVQPVWRWRAEGWTPSGCYVPATASLASSPAWLPAPLNRMASAVVLVESPNVVDDLMERSRLAGRDEDWMWQAIRRVAGPHAQMARVSDMVELDQLDQRVREAA